jgi:hypothetical protein
MHLQAVSKPIAALGTGKPFFQIRQPLILAKSREQRRRTHVTDMSALKALHPQNVPRLEIAKLIWYFGPSIREDAVTR